MQLPVILGLAALWAIVLTPDLLRRRQTRRSADSISTFSRHLSMLQQTNQLPATGRAPRVPATRRPTPARTGGTVVQFAPRAAARRPVAQPAARPARAPQQARQQVRPAAPVPQRPTAAQRRQEIIVGLGAAALLSLLGMLTFGGAMLFVHLAIDLALIAYLALALQVSRVERTSAQVSYLPQHRTPEPAMVEMRRVASR